MIRRVGTFFQQAREIQQVRKIDGEHEQALLRVVFALIIFTYLFLIFDSDKNSSAQKIVLIFSGIFFIYAALLERVISFSQKPSETRQTLAMVADLSAVTFGILMTRETGTLFYGIYLWVIVGNGLRYGTRALIRSHVLSVVGFTGVILTNDYWLTHSTLAVGLLLTLILIPLYTLKLLERLNQAVTHAEEASKAKSHFLAHMSHEMRTPMNSVLGMAQLALKREANPRQRDYLEKIHLSGEHLLGIIDDILNLSKIDAGKLSIETIDFELDKVTQNLVNLAAWQASEKGIKLTFDIDPGISRTLRGDPLRLSQILINYINNAVKFTEQGEIIIRARKIEESENDNLLRFEVQDTGIGIAKEEMAKLFQTFQQADTSTSRKYGGSGLGLVISKGLAELMGGEVGVESEAGKGSTFWFTVRLGKGSRLELLPPEEDGSGGQCQADRLRTVLAAINGAHILLAEDNLFNQQVVVGFLEDSGANVSVASNGKEALDLLCQKRFDCVLMDVQMPGMDGLEATRLIRANPALAGTRVIAMTANATNEDRERCLAAGMDDFIGKPFKPNMFYATLAKWLPARPQQTYFPVTPSTPSVETTLGGDPNIIDLAVLAELMGNDRKKIREFALRFIESARIGIAKIEAALENKDMAALGALGHHVKSPARMVGAMGFANLCQALEHSKDSGDVEQARGIVSQLRPLLERIKEHIDKNLA